MDQVSDKPDHDLTLEQLVKLVEQGKAKVQVLKYFQYGHFSYLAGRLLSQVENSDDEDAEDDLIPVILLQAAALECFLNDVLIEFARESFGKGSKSVAEGLLGGSVRSKVLRVVPVLSKATKVLDAESDCVKNLLNLIKIRNKIAHTTEYYLDEFQDFNRRPQEPQLTATLTVEQCRQYQTSLNTFFCAVWNGPIEDPPWRHELIRDAEPKKQV